MGFVDPFYAYYDSKLLKRRSPHVPLDRLPKDIAEYKKLGVRILGVYPPCLQGEVYETHPEWRRIATNTTEIPTIDMKKYPHGGMLCLLGPYGDFFIDVLAEILTKFPDVDAFSFDGLHYGGVCYCEHCRDELPQGHRQGDPQRGPERPGVPPLPALGRPADGGPRPADADAAEGDQAGRRAGHLDDQRRPVRALPEHPAQHAGADEPAARRPRPGVLARRDQPRHDHRAGVRQRLHLGDDEPPRRLQRAVHPEPRQPVRQGQLPAARDPAADDAGADLRRRPEHRRRPAARTCSRSSTTAWTRCRSASRG